MNPLIVPPPFMVIEAEVGQPLTCGTVAHSEWRMIPILGGQVTGAFSGLVVSGGADWQSVGPDGNLEIAARYLLELDGGLVEVRSDGMRNAAPPVLERLAKGESVPATDYYFRTAMRFRTGSPQLQRLNAILAIAIGERLSDRVRLHVHEIP